MKFECLEDLWRSHSSQEWWDLRCLCICLNVWKICGGDIPAKNGGTFEVLSVEEVRAKITKIQSEEALSAEEVRTTVIRIQSRALSVEEIRATAIVKNQSFVVEDSR